MRLCPEPAAVNQTTASSPKSSFQSPKGTRKSTFLNTQYFISMFTLLILSDHRDTSIFDDLHPVKAQLGAQVRNSPICFCLLDPCLAEGTQAARGEAQVLQVHVERTRTLTGKRPARSLGLLPLLRPYPDLSLSVLYHHGLLCLWP